MKTEKYRKMKFLFYFFILLLINCNNLNSNNLNKKKFNKNSNNFNNFNIFNKFKNNQNIRKLPENKSVDWRNNGVVSQVLNSKNEKNCSYSTIISTVSSINSFVGIYSNRFKEFSYQEFIDCNKLSCNTNVNEVINYYSERKVTLNKEYNYTGIQDICINANYKGFDIPKLSYTVVRSEENLDIYLSNEPIIAKIYIDPLIDYKGGIFTDYNNCKGRPNHYVLIVGYGIENGTEYWSIQNNFGKEWGENGYFRIIKGYNACGIGDELYYIYLYIYYIIELLLMML